VIKGKKEEPNLDQTAIKGSDRCVENAAIEGGRMRRKR